jgi:hypothetical protein
MSEQRATDTVMANGNHCLIRMMDEKESQASALRAIRSLSDSPFGK